MKIDYQSDAESVTISVISVDETTKEETVIDSATFKVSEVPATLKHGEKEESLVVYGLKKLLQDRTSQIPEPEEKLAAMREQYEQHFTQGLWKAPSSVSVRKAAIDPLFAQAVADLKGFSVAKSMALLQALDKDTRQEIREADAVVKRIEELRAEMAGVDTESLIADLLG